MANDTTTARIDPAMGWGGDLAGRAGTGELPVSRGALWVCQDDGNVLRIHLASGRSHRPGGGGERPAVVAGSDAAVFRRRSGGLGNHQHRPPSQQPGRGPHPDADLERHRGRCWCWAGGHARPIAVYRTELYASG